MWTVKIPNRIVRQLDALEDGPREECLDLIEELRTGEFEDRTEPLRGHRKLERIKFYRKAYRLIYSINRKSRRIVITRITKRDEKTYRGYNPA